MSCSDVCHPVCAKVRKLRLTLLLLVLRVPADNHDLALALDDLALLADLLNRWFNLHSFAPALSYFTRQVILPWVGS